MLKETVVGFVIKWGFAVFVVMLMKSALGYDKTLTSESIRNITICKSDYCYLLSLQSKDFTKSLRF